MAGWAQLNVRIPADLRARLDGILAKLRAAFSAPGLSQGDAAGMGLDLLDQWLDLYLSTRPALLAQVEPHLLVPLDDAGRKKGRPRARKGQG